VTQNLLITNEGGTLGERLRNLIGVSRELRVLVGFFYFSGVRALQEALEKNPDIRLRVLVGLEAEEHGGRLVEFVKEYGGELSNGDIQRLYLESLRESFRSKALDREEFYARVGLYVDLLESGRLEIRKTRKPNHAKMYLFNLKDEHSVIRPQTWITGSSNLSQPGLEGQGELNVELSDMGTAEAEAYFEELWKEAVPLTEREEVRAEILAVIRKESILAQPTPFEAYAMVLQHYLEQRQQLDKKSRIEHVLQEAGFDRFAHQVDAVNQALATLDAYNGVLIADVVGLGKSVVGSAIGYMRRKRGIVIAPPGLLGDKMEATGWKAYLKAFHLPDWRTWSCGDLKRALEFVNEDGDFEMVVVDEAHRFRNQDTEDYHLLSQICRGKEVVLLTATPFNNHPNDFFSLMKLFDTTKQSPLVLDGDLEGAFRGYGVEFSAIHDVLKHGGRTDDKTLEKVARPLRRLGIELADYVAAPKEINRMLKARAQSLAAKVRQVIEPVTIRRNRIDLKTDPDYQEDAKGLPEMQDPMEQFFELSKEQDKFYDKIINETFGEDSQFHGAIYRPYVYMRDGESDGNGEEDAWNVQQSNMYKFMLRLLVRRFESSFGAFARSLDSVIRIHEETKGFVKRTGQVLVNREFMNKLMSLEDDELDQALQEYREMLEGIKTRRRDQIYDVRDPRFNRAQFTRELDQDLKLLRNVRDEVRALKLTQNDPKAAALIREMGRVLAGKYPGVKVAKGEPLRKVIVFSEYTDTIEHLRPLLEAAFPGRVLTVGRGGIGQALDMTIKTNFDASVPKSKQRKEFDVLLASDKMSEGYNLNRAGLVINYDIPWNPTRVIQRVGRINRIGKRVFAKLYLFHFFPTVRGADIVKSREIAGNKMFAIHQTLGEDARVFAVDETPTASSLYQKLNRNPYESEEESFYTRAKRKFKEIVEADPELPKRLGKFPNRVKTASAAKQDGVFVFRKKGRALFSLLHRDGQKQEITIEDALNEIECAPDTPALELSTRFWGRYRELCEETPVGAATAAGATAFGTQARMRIQEALENERFVDYRSFLSTLHDDIQHYGTLGERTLRKIFESRLDNDQGIANMRKLLDRLIEEMGGDYLDHYKRAAAEDEIIIGIERRAE
jgi:SNF2 family DNA or RNA helicase